MKIMLLAFAAAILIAVAADFALRGIGFSAEERTTGSSVRID